MKFLARSLVVLFVSYATAFPPGLDVDTISRLTKRIEQSAASQLVNRQINVPPPPFNAAEQYVDTTGEHRWIAPGPNDARGECPGLNAMANHGYIPRNGIATILQFLDACETVFAMAPDLAGFLAVYGATVNGPLLTFSIGGLPRTGILGGHSNYESDSSAFHSDLNQYGRNDKFVWSQFMRLYNSKPKPGVGYDLSVIRPYRASRFQDSVAKNPYFVFTPVAGQQVSSAAYCFLYRLWGNKSEEYPLGTLSKHVLKSFVGVTGPENNLKQTYGHERIPDNWYRRSNLLPYTIPELELDILYMAEAEPRILTTGCNDGSTNSYLKLTPQALTNGAYTAQQALQSPMCFATQFAIASIPALTGLSSVVLAPLIGALQSATSGMNCAAIGSVNLTAFAVCPGYTNYAGPTGPIAPGAIQDP